MSPYACLRWLPVWLPRNMVSLANDWCPGFSEGACKPTTVDGHRAVLGDVIGRGSATSCLMSLPSVTHLLRL